MKFKSDVTCSMERWRRRDTCFLDQSRRRFVPLAPLLLDTALYRDTLVYNFN